VRSPFVQMEGMPLQTVAAAGVAGHVELEPALAPAIRDLVQFSHVWLLCDLHWSSGYDVELTPFLDERPQSLFATRSPRRPNPIGLSLVRVTGVEGPNLLVEELDLLDGTPVLDIKPYVPLFDARETSRIGWFAEGAARVFERRADGRYAGPRPGPAPLEPGPDEGLS
jgi:tRNA (adenine37-N6)-methyltransferase